MCQIEIVRFGTAIYSTMYELGLSNKVWSSGIQETVWDSNVMSNVVRVDLRKRVGIGDWHFYDCSEQKLSSE